MNCSICSCDFDIDEEGGCCGSLGILPVQFCPTCLNGVFDMVDQLQGREYCEDCCQPKQGTEWCECPNKEGEHPGQLNFEKELEH